jgi:serine/threonine-protein kinase
LARDADGALCTKVLDFGIASARAADLACSLSTLTDTGGFVGSPGYMAPEQVRGARDADARVDVWALGVILYEALSGKAPFRGANMGDTLVRIVSEPHEPLRAVAPEVPAGLAAIVELCLEKERERRPRTIAELARMLAPYATSRSEPALRSVLAREPRVDEPSTIDASPSPERSAARLPERSSVLRRRSLRGGILLAAIVGLCAALVAMRLLARGASDSTTMTRAAVTRESAPAGAFSAGVPSARESLPAPQEQAPRASVTVAIDEGALAEAPPPALVRPSASPPRKGSASPRVPPSAAAARSPSPPEDPLRLDIRP